ncbi:hypothetical protein GCM10010353_54940 [Streptomyces chryseus]|nr:hypothetical protein GCM10010353_54940 [Streptomyces chryseus]
MGAPLEAQEDVPDQQDRERQEPPAVRSRARTPLIITAAAALGIVGGLAAGYTVQADRPPTPLPALAQENLAYPAKSLPGGKEPEPLSAKDDHRVRTDGDLRKLLVPKPAGAPDADASGLKDGWKDIASYALEFESPDYMFGDLADADFRRMAAVAWEPSAHREVYVRLVQYHPGPVHGAAEHAEGQQGYMDGSEDGAGNAGDALKGSGNGRYWLYPVKNTAGYLPQYRARALFHRGDVMVDIDIFDTKRISERDIRVLAERQLERM